MDPILISAILVAVVFLLLVGWFISTMNKLTKMKVKVDESLSGIDVALTKRYDLLTKMLEVSKGYLKYEKETLKEIVQMRNPSSCNSIAELKECEKEMAQVAKQLNIVMEQYPNLKANETMMQLNEGIQEVEENLSAARRLYNSNVTIYNQTILCFPSSIVAKMRHHTSQEFFKAEESKKQDVEIDFGF